MTPPESISGLNAFLSEHASVARPTLCGVGQFLDVWRVTAFLGKGGNAEVYRVVRDSDGEVAAAKVLLRTDDASRRRFRQEIELLSSLKEPYVQKFYASGMCGEAPYFIAELLEPVDLPHTEREIARYLLAVCEVVDRLHRLGLVHRDIKPSNVMRRTDGELVLIDFGLVKDTMKSSEPEQDVSVVSGKLVAVGTPRFAAPEQLTGGEVTAAADIHAIGRLANELFHLNPPRAWLPIIRRATSSIPGQRYLFVSDLAQAIRRRHFGRHAVVTACVSAALLLAVVILPDFWRTTVVPARAWRAICENVSTNLVDRELLWERPVTNTIGHRTVVLPERAYRNVKRQAEMTIVRLGGRTNAFVRPIRLRSSVEYLVEGPGRLVADLRADGGPVRVHLKNCLVYNTSSVPVKEAQIRYVFEGGVYLNFVNLDRQPHTVVKSVIEDYDSAFNIIDFRGARDPTVERNEPLW